MKANAVVVSVLLSGCTTTHTVTTLHPRSASDRATGELADGGTIEMHATQTPGGLRWQADKTGVLVDSAALESYMTVNHGKGALQGLGIGLCSGVAAGVVTGLASGSDPPDTFLRLSASDKAVILGVVIGGIGGLAGLVLGAVSGTHEIHVGSADVPRISPTMLPGGAGAMASWSF